MIDPVVAFNHGVAHRLSLSLATLVVDQTLTSESDVPFEPFTASFDVGASDGDLVQGCPRVRADPPARAQSGSEVLRERHRGH